MGLTWDDKSRMEAYGRDAGNALSRPAMLDAAEMIAASADPYEQEVLKVCFNLGLGGTYADTYERELIRSQLQKRTRELLGTLDA